MGDNNNVNNGPTASTSAAQLGPDDDASLLRFLVDMKGEAVSDKQLRDDLMTMLVAGHETTVKGSLCVVTCGREVLYGW